MTPCCQSQCLCLRPISNWCYSCPTRASRTQSFTRCFRLTLYSLSIPAKRRMCCPWSLRSDSYYCLYVQGVNSLWRLKHTDTGTPWFISWIILLTVEDGQYDHDCLYQPSRSIVPHDNVETSFLWWWHITKWQFPFGGLPFCSTGFFALIPSSLLRVLQHVSKPRVLKVSCMQENTHCPPCFFFALHKSWCAQIGYIHTQSASDSAVASYRFPCLDSSSSFEGKKIFVWALHMRHAWSRQGLVWTQT